MTILGPSEEARRNREQMWLDEGATPKQLGVIMGFSATEAKEIAERLETERANTKTGRQKEGE